MAIFRKGSLAAEYRGVHGSLVGVEDIDVSSNDYEPDSACYVHVSAPTTAGSQSTIHVQMWNMSDYTFTTTVEGEVEAWPATNERTRLVCRKVYSTGTSLADGVQLSAGFP